MAITATTSTRKLVPAGNYFAAVVGIYDIGTQPSDKYEPTHQVIFSFELHKKKGVCKDGEGRALLFNRYFSLKLGINKQTKKPSALREAVEALIGRSLTAEEALGFDVTQLLDRTCRLTVAHSEDGASDMIKAFTPMDDDDPKIGIETDSMVYELDPSGEIPSSVPEWIQKTIHKSNEWTKANKSNGNGNGEDKAPF